MFGVQYSQIVDSPAGHMNSHTRLAYAECFDHNENSQRFTVVDPNMFTDEGTYTG
jgi:hypothetical protein